MRKDLFGNDRLTLNSLMDESLGTIVTIAPRPEPYTTTVAGTAATMVM